MAGTIKVKMDSRGGDRIAEKFRRGVTRYSEAQTKAIQSTTYITADKIETQGRADIARSGNFGSERWQDGLRAKVSYKSRTDLQIRVTHNVKYWRVFEFAPTTIKAKNPSGFLWIPLDFAGIPKGLSAKDFSEPLFRVDRPGKAPLLVSQSGPKYFGKEQVTITTRWHLRSVIARCVRTMAVTYRKELARFKKG